MRFDHDYEPGAYKVCRRCGQDFTAHKAPRKVSDEHQAAAEEAKGNLVFRDESGKPVAVFDTSNL